MGSSSSDRWGLVLAGGDGSRLKTFTRRVVGYDLPKQFCPILSSKSLLEETLARVSRVVSPVQTVISLNREHRRFYAPMLREAPQILIEAPGNRGTAPAVLHAVMRLHDQSPTAVVGLFPSDHYIGDEYRFAEQVISAFDVAGDIDDTVVLLGAEASGPEEAYGWIVPETSMTTANQRLLSVRRFVEKPEAALANELWRSGALWNTLVLVGRASALLQIFVAAMPDLYSLFCEVRSTLGTDDAGVEALRTLYDRLPVSSFSEAVLQQCADHLTVMPMYGVAWSDLGEPLRVMEVARRLGGSPKWAVG
jgi:mannose-1-phosphate guanylyltransferase